MRVPGLSTARIHTLHDALGIDSIESLEEALRDGRVAKLPRYGTKTAEKILGGSNFSAPAARGGSIPTHAAEGARLLAMVRAHPAVLEAEVAGSLRRQLETVGDVDIVAACRQRAHRGRRIVRQRTGRAAARAASGTRRSPSLTSTAPASTCTASTPSDFAVALWRATGSAEHVDAGGGAARRAWLRPRR